MRSTSTALALCAVALAAAACDSFSRPNRPPGPFAADGLDGRLWDNEALRGKPWVVNLWMPG
jgi:hypothetical protein